LSEYPINSETWQAGLTMQTFIERLTDHKEAMQRRYQTVELTEDEKKRFAALNKPVKMVVVTEEWCTDCLMVLPILAKIAAAAAQMELRIYVRREWPQLRDYYTGQDIHSIPVASFLDENFKVISCWIERPAAGHTWLANWKGQHPEIEITRKRADLSSDEKRALLKTVMDQLLVDMEAAYDADLQSETVCEVANLLSV
jgi:thiol-disulfide isomerase/thioredoxin